MSKIYPVLTEAEKFQVSLAAYEERLRQKHQLILESLRQAARSTKKLLQ